MQSKGKFESERLKKSIEPIDDLKLSNFIDLIKTC